MGLKTLKLELLERIALIDDQERLLALKRTLDAPRTYAPPGGHLSVVEEGETRYFNLEERNYTAAEVRALLNEVLQSAYSGTSGDDGISDAELAELDRRHQARLSGESKGLPWKESMARLRAKDRP